MKKILIIGARSYIGTSFERWCSRFPYKYLINTIDIRNEFWKNISFQGYDVIFYVAGMVHKKETKKNIKLYYEINRDLSFEVAKKSKNDGVTQFIYLSSASVYGIETGVIYENTMVAPNTNYGKSKFQAEELLKQLVNNSFKLVIIRPPMIYGKGCKGNYNKLRTIALNMFLFPDIKNERSMIYIDNLCEFVRILIEDCAEGLFFPQNEEYVCTSNMVKSISDVNGKKLWLTNNFNVLLRLISGKIKNKVFGDLVYVKEMSIYNKNYCVSDFQDSIIKTES